MKKIAFAFLIMCTALGAGAQKVFFIYIQSENRVPFYVRMADKVYSSSSSGYLIISNLVDSTYTFSIGYPASKTPEARFFIPIEGTDKGFLVKNFEEGTGLFDLQTLKVYNQITNGAGTEQAASRTDAFTKRLAQAANDESLLTVPVAKTETPKTKESEKEPTKEVVKTELPAEVKKVEAILVDSVATAKTEPVVEAAKKEEVKTESAIKTPDSTITQEEAPKTTEIVPAQPEEEMQNELPYTRSVVTRRSESSTTEGFGLVFLDTYNGTTDTIRLLIPNQKKTITEKDTMVEEPGVQIQTEIQTKNPVQEITIAPPQKKGNSCNTVATEKDFLKLRKNMAAQSNDEAMIAEARKYFKTRCFTTEQIRYLSTLFLTNAAKYQFFDAAYMYVSDSTLFPSLASEIKDEYYSRRFKALIGAL